MRYPLFMAAVVPLVCSFATAADEGADHWAYSGATGPSHWGEICTAGKEQSPIDIRTAEAKGEDLPALAFDYQPGPLRIVDNGHSIQVDVAQGSTLSVGGARYSLVQFHFHAPSEETIDGRHHAMVVHLVHRGAEGNLVVVAVPLSAGAANPELRSLWQHLPHEKEHEEAPARVTIDPSRLLPAERAYFTYAGSLTTPPCTEGVRWLVLKSPTFVSAEEIARFAKLYPGNARPVQPLNGREVLASR